MSRSSIPSLLIPISKDSFLFYDHSVTWEQPNEMPPDQDNPPLISKATAKELLKNPKTIQLPNPKEWKTHEPLVHKTIQALGLRLQRPANVGDTKSHSAFGITQKVTKWMIDSGASHHIVSRKSVKTTELYYAADPIRLHTANGEVVVDRSAS